MASRIGDLTARCWVAYRNERVCELLHGVWLFGHYGVQELQGESSEQMTEYGYGRAIQRIGESFKFRKSRFLLLEAFQNHVLPRLKELDSDMPVRVAVVGGGYKEPELLLLRELGYEVHVVVFGIDVYDHFLDLNQLNPANLNSNKFDLVLCSQVLEHTWNISNVLDNLTSLVSTRDGSLWINFPRSNREHGYPDYFFSGITPSVVQNFLSIATRPSRVLASGSLGTQRLYFMTHALPTWPSNKAHSFPLLFAFDEIEGIRRIPSYLFYFPLILVSQFISVNPQKREFHTESYLIITVEDT